jgi:hypothetical protein
MILKAASIAAILTGLASPSAAMAQLPCYDAMIRASPIDQIPSEIGDCGGDCIIMSWPWFIDLKVVRVIDGALAGQTVRVLAVQHTYHLPREGTWLLRRNDAGGYNVLTPENGPALVRCTADTPAAEAYIRSGPGQSLNDLRDAGVRHYGHHTK